MIRRILMCYLFLVFVLLMQAEMAQRDEQAVIQWSQQ